MTIQTGDYHFLTDDSSGIRLVFASTALLETTGEKTPLWWCTCPDDDYRDALCAWVGARRHLWSGWGRLAEAEGHDALARHIVALSRLQPLEVPCSVVLTPGDDARVLDIGVMFEPLRTQAVYQHRFRSAAARARFMAWFHSDDHHAFGWVLARIGLLQGGATLGAVLDDLARSRTVKVAA